MPPPTHDEAQVTASPAMSQSSSFVYPVRSLLSGIQPAADRTSQEAESDLSPVGPEVAYANDGVQEPTPAANFVDYSREEDPLAPRVFSSSHSLHPHTHHHQAHHHVVIGPAGEPVPFDPAQMVDDDGDYNPRHPPTVSDIAAQGFADVVQASFPDPDPYISNFSTSGIVHLAPIESPESSRGGTSFGSRSNTGSRGYGSNEGGRGRGSASSAQSIEDTLDVVQMMPSTRSSRPGSPVSASGSGSMHPSSLTDSSSDGPRVTFRYQHVEDEHGHHLIVGREGRLTKCEDEPIRTPGAVQGFGVLVAVQEDDETGNLVVRQVSENSAELLGLSPSYLFSLECFSQTLSHPQADLLFDNIQYLSDTALTPEEQAENLHVFLLSGHGEPGSILPEEESMYPPNHHMRDPLKRRTWSCWCAAHRPRMTAPANLDDSGGSTDAALDSNLIILEFELERDHFNPLYPPLGLETDLRSSNISSPSGQESVASSGSYSEGSAETGRVSDSNTSGSGSGRMSESSGRTSESSGRTLVSTDSGIGEAGTAVGTSSPGEGLSTGSPGSGGSTSVSSTAHSPSPPVEVGQQQVGQGGQAAQGQSIQHFANEMPLQDLQPGHQVEERQQQRERERRERDQGQTWGHAQEQRVVLGPDGVRAVQTSTTHQTSLDSDDNLNEDEGQESEYAPSPEDILESTTSHSKPLLALERLRRSRRGHGDGTGTPSSGGFRGSRSRRGGFNRSRPGGGPLHGHNNHPHSGGGHYNAGGGSGGSGGGGHNTGGGGGVGGAVGMMDVFAVMAQINEQLGSATDLDHFLKVVVGVIKDLTQFHRVLVYQFDEAWNGKVVAELVDWAKTHDIYRGLHFPATDIPAQARGLYAVNKVRLLYDRGLATARLVVRSKKDLETPLDMTHCYLRAMSPIHIKYLGNMGVRASMSVSIVAFNRLWGLVACHTYGPHGMRVSFPVRQMLRLLSQSIGRNVERLSYAQRLHTRKLINTTPTEQHPSGYIVSNADDLLGLFDADFGVLVIGEGAKILGPNVHSQEVLVVAEYLRLKQFDTMQVSQQVTTDYPDLQLSRGLEVVAGLLYVPLSVGGRDFIAFLRKGQPRQVKWAGRPPTKAAVGYGTGADIQSKTTLEPRKSFKTWCETVAGRCRAWTDEHLETAGVLALVYGKFIEVWRQKETALQATKLTNILLSNASHEVRTPLNHIINYLELALNGQLDGETRENLSQSHAASKSLLFTINDLLDLTRLESGHETSFNEPFNLAQTMIDATMLYRNEASRRGLTFELDLSRCPKTVIGDAKKIRTVVANLTANAVKYTNHGKIKVQCQAFDEPAGLRGSDNVAVEIVVEDTGCGIHPDKLESIFREFEQVDVPQPPNVPTPQAQSPQPQPGGQQEGSSSSSSSSSQRQQQGLGLGLAVVARIVEQLGGQLRVDSKVTEGSRFSFLLPFATQTPSISDRASSASPSRSNVSSMDLSQPRSRRSSSSLPNHRNAHLRSHGGGGAGGGGRNDEIDNLVQALTSTHLQVTNGGGGGAGASGSGSAGSGSGVPSSSRRPSFDATPSSHSRRGTSPYPPPAIADANSNGNSNSNNNSKLKQLTNSVPDPEIEQEVARKLGRLTKAVTAPSTGGGKLSSAPATGPGSGDSSGPVQLRILIVEDNDINRTILAKRLTLDGHAVVNTTNGQEGLEMVQSDRDFDCVLMDIQMPIINGYEATERIRALEQSHKLPLQRHSQRLNGRLPIFAVSASLFEEHRDEMYKLGIDGWILKPIDFKRLRVILKGVTDLSQRERDVYRPGCNWESGGWLTRPRPHHL